MSAASSQIGNRTSAFTNALCEGIERTKSVIESNLFTFIVNKVHVETTVFEALLLSQAVQERMKNDRSDNTFVIEEESIDSESMSKLIRLFSGDSVEICLNERKSMISLCRILKNKIIEKMIFGLSVGQSSSFVMTFRDFQKDRLDETLIASHFYLYSRDDLLMLDVETLNEVISNDSLVVLSEDSLLEQILEFGREYLLLLGHLRFENLSLSGISRFFDMVDFSDVTESIWCGLSYRLKGGTNVDLKSCRYHAELDSTIIDNIPSMISEIAGKRIELLYRGTRDGFASSSFHSKCDHQSHTITIVETTKGMIFGGYTPISWDSTNTYKQDDSLKSFIFTLKNGRNTEPRKFSLKSDHNTRVIRCNQNDGPIFGGGHDLHISANSNETTSNYTNFGCSYQNDTGYDGQTFLAGEKNFTVKELEVFVIRERMNQ
jgi:hypothetical protein